MFLQFQSQEERRRYGGSCFIELQFCRAAEETPVGEIMQHFSNWMDDSLYVHGDSPLYTVYGAVFGNGLHPNMTESDLDMWGVTYYRREQIDGIIARAEQRKPEGYETLTAWLREAKQYNGFFILGV